MNTLTRLLLAPVLVVQGLYTRLTTPSLPEAEGPRAGITGQGPRLSLLLAGDSSAAGVGAATQSESLIGRLVDSVKPHRRIEWKLIAHTGANTASLIKTLKVSDHARFDVAVIAVGVNDVTGRVPVNVWLNQHDKLVRLLKGRFSVKRVLISELPPMGDFPALPRLLRRHLGNRARQFDIARARWALDRPDVTVVPVNFDVTDAALMASDGFHPGPLAYRFWGAVMADRILHDHSSVGPLSEGLENVV